MGEEAMFNVANLLTAQQVGDGALVVSDQLS
jgi:hypothetical protein